MRQSSHILGPLCVAVLLAGAGCEQPPRIGPCPAPPPNSKHSGDGRAWNCQNGFSIVPPEGYSDTGASLHHFMNYLGPCEGDFTVNFNVLVRDDAGTPVKQAGQQARRINGFLLPSYKHVEEGFVIIDGKKCYYCTGTFAWGGRDCQNLQYVIRGGNRRLYVITFASPVESFPAHRPIFEQAAMSARTD